MKRGGRLSRRTPLRNTSPLVRRTPLASGTGLTRASGTEKPSRRPAPSTSDGARALVVQRSGGLCELGLPGCWRRACEVHHRITRKAGGRSGAGRRGADRVSNLMHVCGPCHRWVTGRPAESYGAGWSLREGADPALVPLVLGGADPRLAYLGDDGRVHDDEQVGA